MRDFDPSLPPPRIILLRIEKFPNPPFPHGIVVAGLGVHQGGGEIEGEMGDARMLFGKGKEGGGLGRKGRGALKVRGEGGIAQCSFLFSTHERDNLPPPQGAGRAGGRRTFHSR